MNKYWTVLRPDVELLKTGIQTHMNLIAADRYVYRGAL